MSILVTGGAGYIGSHMVLELLDTGETVIVVDNLSTGHRRAVPPEAILVDGDIGDGELVRNILGDYGVEAIIHFAGSIVVPASLIDPLGFYLNNTVKSRTLIEAAVAQGVNKFIFSSTAAVYGIPNSNPVFEMTPLHPISPYGTSKMMTEMMLADTSRAFDFSYVALRYFNVAGADPKGRTGQSFPEATHLIKVASQTALGQRPYIGVYGTDYPTRDGTCVRDYIQVTDLVRAHSLALDYIRGGGESRILNCGYGRGYSVLEVIDSVQRISGVQFDVKSEERRPGDPAELVAGAKQIRDLLNWEPEYEDLDTIVSQALAWEKKLAALNSL